MKRHSSEEYETTGRYLCIQDGFFLNHGSKPNWVQVYCYECWMDAVMALPFVSSRFSLIEKANKYLKSESKKFKEELQLLKQPQSNLAQAKNPSIGVAKEPTSALIGSDDRLLRLQKDLTEMI